jgi:hypothetical protein
MNLEEVFLKNLKRFEIDKNVRIYPMSSLEAAKYIKDSSLDMMFIDGDHRYESVQADIRAYIPKMKKDGWITGHDILWNDSVAPAVYSIFGQDKVWGEADIWYVIPENWNSVTSSVTSLVTKPKVYDCCIFFNELDVLEIRLEELWDVVDKFIIVEAKHTHQGQPKPLYFYEAKERFLPYISKIMHIIVDEFPNCVTTWDREHYQRDVIARGLKDCKDNDVIIISDADEILKAETVRNYKPEMGVCAVETPLFYFKLDWKLDEKWYNQGFFHILN